MSFFRFEPHDRLKQRFSEVKGEQEDLAVYTWGEDSYDGLGDALQEGGDELNDETFGGTGEVGKFSMFHWIGTAFPYRGQARTSISHSRHCCSITIRVLFRPNRPPSSSHLHSQTHRMPMERRPHLRVRSSQLNPVPLSNSPLPCSSSRPITVGRKVAFLGAPSIEQYFS